jgi:hypothetical protein
MGRSSRRGCRHRGQDPRSSCHARSLTLKTGPVAAQSRCMHDVVAVINQCLTGQDHPHLVLTQQPDLNWANPEVRAMLRGRRSQATSPRLKLSSSPRSKVPVTAPARVRVPA